MIFLIVVYLFLACAGCSSFLVAALLGQIPPMYEPLRIGVACCCTGGIGGTLYCLRAVYLTRCVRNSWSQDWHWWYFLRPVASFICGGVSYLFLKAGLLVLESKTEGAASEVGFYALAFVAGLNVDKFIQKIEGVALAVWGIEKSRSSSAAEKSTSGSAVLSDVQRGGQE
jgi:hypothetical protein